MKFELVSDYKPAGDQMEAIDQLEKGIQREERSQVLLGVTGSGKTFTIANVIERVQKPTLIVSHNKTLVAQLYGEFKQFFPDNAVEYFVSYYDYYQPEAYLPTTDLYIEKDASINEEIEKLRLRTTSSLLSGRRDIIVVASVSCIYGIGNPLDYQKGIIRTSTGQKITRDDFLKLLVEGLYSRTQGELNRGNFRVQGETIGIFLPYADHACRITFFGDEIETIETFNPDDGRTIEKFDDFAIYPANIYMAPRGQLQRILKDIKIELEEQVNYFISIDKELEAKRLKERVTFDMEMMKELGYCPGIENYSRFLDERKHGERPFCLIDYFPEDFLTVIDESHVTVPQVRGMYAGDRSRKTILVDYGFRLPSAMDNRPLTFEEFDNIVNQKIYMSATPAAYELEQTEGVIVEQVVRPTGLLDPEIEVRPSINQIDDLMEEIDERVKVKERVLVTTLTKRMAEELTKYFTKYNIKCKYIHAEVETLERVEILRDLRLGIFDVLVGINLLREGLDLPEVSLVAILDADKEGFLRSERSLTQTSGRAARNINGKVIMYADKITDSMQRTIDETNRRRSKQAAYNEEHNIIPRAIIKSEQQILKQTSVLNIRKKQVDAYIEPQELNLVADPVIQYMDKKQLEKTIQHSRKAMQKAAKELDFLEAARLRDEMYSLEQLLKEKFP